MQYLYTDPAVGVDPSSALISTVIIGVCFDRAVYRSQWHRFKDKVKIQALTPSRDGLGLMGPLTVCLTFGPPAILQFSTNPSLPKQRLTDPSIRSTATTHLLNALAFRETLGEGGLIGCWKYHVYSISGLYRFIVLSALYLTVPAFAPYCDCVVLVRHVTHCTLSNFAPAGVHFHQKIQCSCIHKACQHLLAQIDFQLNCISKL